jgi:hypothetical protein
MESQLLDRRRHIVLPAYFVSILLILFAYLDFLLSIWPFKPGDPRWRFGSVGVISSYSGWILLGYLLMLWFALSAGHQTMLKLLGILCLVEALVLLLATVAFPLDVLQIRREVPPDDLWTFTAAAGRAVLKNLASIAAFAWMALAAFRGTRSDPGHRSRRTEPSPLIVGSDRG